MINSIKCKKCGASIEITRAIFDEARAEIEPQLKQQAVKEVQEQYELDKKSYEFKLKQQAEKMEELKNRELKLMENNFKLEQEKRESDIKIARQVEEKTKDAFAKAFKLAQDEFRKREQDLRLKELEKNKIIESLKNDLSEAQRKTQVGSQQLQGEVLELEIEEMLKRIFPHDVIEEIAKGVNGSDIRHIVKSPLGINCGTILWECKRTKNWSPAWIAKLKADLRDEKADISILVSTCLPKDFSTGIGFLEDVYICESPYATFLARILRERIIAVARQKAISANKESKAERLYSYITSNEFKEQLKFMFETYKKIKEQIDKERKVFEKNWKEREIQLEQLVNGTTRVYATIAAELGSSMPQLEDFEIKALDSGK